MPSISAKRLAAVAQLTAAEQIHEFSSAKVNGNDYRVFKNLPVNFSAFFQDSLQFAEADCLVYQDERLSFEQCWQQASAIGQLLQQQYGIKKGDRVAICMRNYPEWVLCFMAITSIGGIAVAMNAWWQTGELEYGLDNCGAKLLIADQERLDRIGSELQRLDIQALAVRPKQTLPDNCQDLAKLLPAYQGQTMPEVACAADDDALILFTSGSTGHPKGAVSSHRAALTAILSWELELTAVAMALEITPEEPEFQAAVLLSVPLFHVTGLHAGLLSSFRNGRKTVLTYKWDVDQALDIVDQEKISNFVAPPAMTGDLVNAAKKAQRDFPYLKVVGGGGAPRAPEQVREIDNTFSNVMPNTGWGMTETNAIGTSIFGPLYLTRPDSSGICASVLDIRIVNEKGVDLPVGQRGEVWIKGPSLIRGYWNNAKATAETFTDGWLHTGDVAYLDEEGYLFIVDRIKDMVIRGGENIGCAEVEAAFYEHPKITEVAVFGLPDERLGEELAAVYFAEEQVDETELRGFLKQRLAGFKVPKSIWVSAKALPRIASGKIQKRQLRDQKLAELGAADA